MKNFLGSYFMEHLQLKMDLILSDPRSSPNKRRKNIHLYKRFRKVGYAVIAINRFNSVIRKNLRTKDGIYEI